MSRIIPPADYADLALSIRNSANVIYGAADPSMTSEAAEAVKAAITVAKRDLMRLRRELNCAVATARRVAKAEAERNAELDAENARLLADAAADEAGRLARYAAEAVEQVAA